MIGGGVHALCSAMSDEMSDSRLKVLASENLVEKKTQRSVQATASTSVYQLDSERERGRKREWSLIKFAGKPASFTHCTCALPKVTIICYEIIWTQFVYYLYLKKNVL